VRGGPGLASETWVLRAKRNPGLKSETWATPYLPLQLLSLLTLVSMETIIVSMEIKPAAPIPTLESHLGYKLRRISNAVSGQFARALQEKQTSVAEWVLMRELYERGRATPGDLAELLGMTRGAISKVVDKLEAKTWIHTQAKDDDNRARLLSLTRAGRRQLPVLAKIADHNDAHFFACLDKSERRALSDLLAKLAEHHHIQDVPTD
jgi:DNA-binding MarR family transcriptional regulator